MRIFISCGRRTQDCHASTTTNMLGLYHLENLLSFYPATTNNFQFTISKFYPYNQNPTRALYEWVAVKYYHSLHGEKPHLYAPYKDADLALESKAFLQYRCQYGWNIYVVWGVSEL